MVIANTSPHIINMLTAKSAYYQYAVCQVHTWSICGLPSPQLINMLTDKSAHYQYADYQVRILSICWLPSLHIINMLTAKSAHYKYADCWVFMLICADCHWFHWIRKLVLKKDKKLKTPIYSANVSVDSMPLFSLPPVPCPVYYNNESTVDCPVEKHFPQHVHNMYDWILPTHAVLN